MGEVTGVTDAADWFAAHPDDRPPLGATKGADEPWPATPTLQAIAARNAARLIADRTRRARGLLAAARLDAAMRPADPDSGATR